MGNNLIGACIFGQSGGPTSVINSSAAGVFIEALKQKSITKVYGAANGIKGILDEKFYDIGAEDKKELLLLKNTPSSALGSVRYKLKKVEEDETDYKRILEVFKKYDIRYFFYNGGNDSMDTCNKVSKYLLKNGYECRVIGVPKTIDNDLFGTDHCPGYGSAAKYIATTLMELYLDATVYNKGQITVVEIMGRNAGWLTAASQLAISKGFGPDLVYLPEKAFDIAKFIDSVKAVADKKSGMCIVAVSEGIKTADGTYVVEALAKAGGAKDSFGHTQLGGVAQALANLVSEKIGGKVRAIEFSLMQRCAAHVASKTDVEESFNAGREAVKAAVSGNTDQMVIFERKAGLKYQIEYKLLPLEQVANTEKTVPLEWINDDNTGLTEDFVNYALPLVQGENEPSLEDGLPRFARLKKVEGKK